MYVMFADEVLLFTVKAEISVNMTVIIRLVILAQLS